MEQYQRWFAYLLSQASKADWYSEDLEARTAEYLYFVGWNKASEAQERWLSEPVGLL